MIRFAIIIFLLIAGNGFAQHLRIYACAIGNDSAGVSLGASSNGSGLYQSDDTGKTWKHLGWDNIKCYSMDEVESSNGRILYEATGLGILRSTDYGEHWKQITDWRISEAMDVAVNQKNPNEIYIATAHGPWRSEDGGKRWIKVRSKMDPYTDVVIIRKGKAFWGADGEESDQDIVWIPDREDWEIRLIGTLDKGVFLYPNWTLQLRQIWTLKSFLVTP